MNTDWPTDLSHRLRLGESLFDLGRVVDPLWSLVVPFIE